MKAYRNRDGQLTVRNLSAYWLPEFTLKRKIGGTVYSVTGSYEGTGTIDSKFKRILAQNLENREEHP